MVQIVGKYQFISHENFEEFMKSLGHPELVAPFLVSKPVVEVKNAGDQWSITVNNDGHTSTTTFKPNEPYEETLPASDRKFKSITAKDGNAFKTETQVGNFKVVRVYEFSDAGMKVYLSTTKDDVKATRTYKRI